jgi:flavin-dependent dehydrogenase
VALTGLAALPEKCGIRWIAVGDAAAKLDPLASSGTAAALDSGQRAAHAVADALQGDTAGLDRYARWSAGLVTEFARQRRQQYQYEARRQENAFWSRRILVAA